METEFWIFKLFISHHFLWQTIISTLNTSNVVPWMYLKCEISIWKLIFCLHFLAVTEVFDTHYSGTCLRYGTRTSCTASGSPAQCTRSTHHRPPWCRRDSARSQSWAWWSAGLWTHGRNDFFAIRLYPLLEFAASFAYNGQWVAICPRWRCRRWIDFLPDMLNICHRPRVRA